MSDTLESLKPYLHHKMDLQYRPGDKESLAECPFCGRDKKFSVNLATGKWRCFVCAEGNGNGGGNSLVFLRKLFEKAPYAKLVQPDLKSRRLLSDETLQAWGVCVSPINKGTLIPGYDVRGEVSQLYRYVLMKEGNRRLIPTPTLGHQLHRSIRFDPNKETIYVCEGPWDGMILEEMLLRTKLVNGSEYALTSNPDVSLLADANVVAIPGCGSVGEPFKKLVPLFQDKKVILCFDNDHPRKHPTTGEDVAPAAWSATLRAKELLEDVASELSYVRWGEEGFDPALPSGFDLRDAIAGTDDDLRPLEARLSPFEALLGRICLFPSEGLKSQARGLTAKTLELRDCSTYADLARSWKKSMKWTEGLDHAFTVMLASISSTMSVGEQLWIKVIGPASCGKSTLCEAISTAKDYVVAKSTIRGFHSGFRTDGGPDEDNSLLAQVKGKTLITKDGDTLIQSPNLSQILSEARDVYDTVSRTHYRNKASKDYEGVRMTWILCGTSSLRVIDQSELGERFLNAIIMERIDEELEDEIIWRIANRSARNLSVEANCQVETQNDSDMTETMQLTGGYVTYLRKNAQQLLNGLTFGEEQLKKCARFGKFVSFMRARPSSVQTEMQERELAGRLVSQIVRLAGCLAIVLNKETVDSDVMNRVHRVALDTAQGITLRLATYLARQGDDGAETRALAIHASITENEVRNLMRFLRQIGVVEVFQPKSVGGLHKKERRRLTERFKKLYWEVMK